MNLKDFFFSYVESFKIDLDKKRYFKAFRKLFNYPYKFLLDKFRQLFSLKKKNLDKINKNFENKSLNDLFIKFNSDKASKFIINNKQIDGHNYSPIYEKYFQKYKNIKNLNILEIGCLRGSGTASFYYYFCKKKIFCVDINPFQIQIYSKNIRVLYVDTKSKNTLLNLRSYLNESFDIIIDDGSHNIRDQIITMNIFFEKLKKGGLYVIEDSSQYVSSKSLNPDQLNYGSNDILLSVQNNNVEKIKYLSFDEVKQLRENMGNIFSERGNYFENGINISEIIFIEKN